MIIEILKSISLALFGIMPGNYSGITHIEGNKYAIVDDKDVTDGFKILTLDIDSATAKVKNASMQEPPNMTLRRNNGKGIYRDCEGVAYCPDRGTVFVTGEKDQRIAEYSLDGTPTGEELNVPESMSSSAIRQNLGFEALTYNASTKRFWTTTESVLKADGQCSSITSRAICNKLRFISFDLSLNVVDSCRYVMDKPTARKKKGKLVHGVPCMIALDDGSLIVMEREAYFPKNKVGSFCRIKLFHAVPVDGEMRKTLLTTFITHLNLGHLNFANFEGMCLGPRLADGSQTIILIADSQNGKGNALYHAKDYLKIIRVKSF